MLIEFEVGNYLSFKNPVRLSMVAINTDKELLESNTFSGIPNRLLRSTAIYGANASGKSNLIIAMQVMKWFVLNSSKEMQAQEEIPVTSFKLDNNYIGQPSHFEVVFCVNEICYRYGFETTSEAVTAEWLFLVKKTTEVSLYLRSNDSIDVRDKFKDEGGGLENKTRDNALFLSVVAQFNGTISQSIISWFNTFQTLSSVSDQLYRNISSVLLKEDDIKAHIVSLIREADLGIEDLELTEKDDFSNRVAGWIGQPEQQIKILTVHRMFDNGNPKGTTSMELFKDESEGTQKLFRIIGPILLCIRNGYVVTIDELDAKLHPLLTRAIVRLFNSSANKRNAQLIFTTHDTNLLQFGDMRRDQIWFTEKDQMAATDLYSLAEFKTKSGSKVRKDAAYEKNYIQGRYGAIPFLGDFGSLLKKSVDNE